jgi:hypothetical protein
MFGATLAKHDGGTDDGALALEVPILNMVETTAMKTMLALVGISSLGVGFYLIGTTYSSWNDVTMYGYTFDPYWLGVALVVCGVLLAFLSILWRLRYVAVSPRKDEDKHNKGPKNRTKYP